MKNQALFSAKDKTKILKCRLLQFLFGALRVNTFTQYLLKCIVLLFQTFKLDFKRNRHQSRPTFSVLH